MVLGFRVTYYGAGTAGTDSAPMCPCVACWNAPPGVNPHARKPATPKPASVASSSSSSSTPKAKKSYHLGRLLKRPSCDSIRSDMVPLCNATTLDSTSDKSSVMSGP
ncbi:hypothetical protein NKR23_g12323 [Pleurostoma richardsiae]|uniref:Uncharacterized protein n=1 Tax=Pleurostoma richardsiae TaxID=41990 RepID=A0AA38VAY2_9PEZI|nr:hypothetical protein NKR23_g12323 [Pleurostoma richardsiae]